MLTKISLNFGGVVWKKSGNSSFFQIFPGNGIGRGEGKGCNGWEGVKGREGWERVKGRDGRDGGGWRRDSQ